MAIDRNHKLLVEEGPDEELGFTLSLIHSDQCPVSVERYTVEQLGGSVIEIPHYFCDPGYVDECVSVGMDTDGGCAEEEGDPHRPLVLETIRKWMGNEEGMPIVWVYHHSDDRFTGEHDHEYRWVPAELEEKLLA